ncbi:MAG: hypothetical protein QGH83_09475 [Candidatus Pacebacteria bacterium]|jgi:hypothetical protein|nr:hypothetical protein [Candidatus Paceibacterota bacterium]
MANKYPYTWNDVGEKGGGDGIPYTQTEKVAIVTEWNTNYEKRKANEWVKHRLCGKVTSHLDGQGNRVVDSKEKGYPGIQDQLDMQYWDIVNGTNVWKDTIAAVKAKFPKPA